MATLRPDLLARYGSMPVPRYTSYPSANLWGPRDASFAREVYGRAGGRELSLYVHVPFCHKLCFYCGCNMLVTRRQELVERYLAALELESARVSQALGGDRHVVQLHLGGGTPTFLDEQQLGRVIDVLKRDFNFGSGIEAS